MDPKLRRRQITTTLVGWLAIGIGLAICEQLVWDGMWSVTLVVWWGYLGVSALMLLRLLIHSWASRWSRGSLGIVWAFVGLGLMLLWARPLLVQAGDVLLLNFRPEILVGAPPFPHGSQGMAEVTFGT
ncbi:MAG: hypothetical protein ACI9OJ_004434 [Myxococcota bacterium]|jgi:hypothetical protein